MIFSALVLAAAASGGDALAVAQDAFARGAYAEAETLALAAAEPPRDGAALYLAGLARFRLGRPAEALEALDRAALAPDAPPQAAFHYNRGACLYDLGRLAEAEAEFERSAGDPELGAVSLINAGWAALDAGASNRAAAFAARAHAVASGRAAELLAELEAQLRPLSEIRKVSPDLGPSSESQYAEGLAAYDAGKFAEARELFRKSAEGAPGEPKSRIMAGAAAYQLGSRDEARAALEGALALPGLEAADAQTARDYLALLSQPPGWAAAVRVAAGYDTNALQVSEGPGFGAGGTSAESPLLLTEASLLRRFRAGSLAAELGYGIEQLLYSADAASDRSQQQHALTLAFELAPRGSLRLGASASGLLAFAGLSGFRGLQAAATGTLWAALDESKASTTRLDLGFGARRGLSEFAYLTGPRGELALTQELRQGRFAFSGGYVLRYEDLGSLSFEIAPPHCIEDFCKRTQEMPFGYVGNSLWGAMRAAATEKLEVDLSLGAELRNYLHDDVTTANGVEVARMRRRDLRPFFGASATLRLTDHVALTGRYDLVLNRSSVGEEPFQRPPPGTERSYDKHVLTIGTSFAW